MVAEIWAYSIVDQLVALNNIGLTVVVHCLNGVHGDYIAACCRVVIWGLGRTRLLAP